MHEAGIAESILKSVLHALPRPGMKVTRIVVVAGALSGVEEAPLSTWLEHMARRTPAEGAQLDFRRAAAGLACSKCDYRGEYDGSSPLDPLCPKCGQVVRLEAGSTEQGGPTDIYIESLEANDP
jgi:hydrogenase nickel incorporation protein HypA/HybF